MASTPVTLNPSSSLSSPVIAPARAGLACPAPRQLRDRLRALASDLVSSWRAGGMPGAAKTAAGLRREAETLVARAGGSADLVGWTMVTIVSEYWRERLAAGASGRRLLLLPDCPAAGGAGDAGSTPKVCGPSCSIGTVWSAARESGWVVESTERAVSAIGALLTGQYDGILGVAKLSHLEKAFAMLPAFSLPIAAVPYDPAGAAGADGGSCSTIQTAAAFDVDWVLGLLGVAGGGAAPVGDYLPLLREAAELFSGPALADVARRCGSPDAFGPPVGASPSAWQPLDATAAMSGDYLTRGGKFLRPFIALAAFDAVEADRAGTTRQPSSPRDAVKAAAVAIEIFHKASLVHDDIEDADTMRYGRPTLHLDHGVPSAINAGDYLLGLGYRIVSTLPGVDAETQRDLVAILADAHVRLARGQGAELWWRNAADKRLTPAAALEIYGLKTSPAFEAAVAMGIRLAGVQPEAAGAIARYALHVGTGFQVLNDLKDWCGDLENDRRAAGDLLGGRPTVMWALALERLPAASVQRLATLAGEAAGATDPTQVAHALAAARLYYQEADVFERAAAIVEEQRRSAAAAAATCGLGRLRDVLEFLLDLAVPEQAAAQYCGLPDRGRPPHDGR
ncbi:MAG: polyprenyl synthetase family protein [Planctomycetia bacterium]